MRSTVPKASNFIIPTDFVLKPTRTFVRKHIVCIGFYKLKKRVASLIASPSYPQERIQSVCRHYGEYSWKTWKNAPTVTNGQPSALPNALQNETAVRIELHLTGAGHTETTVRICYAYTGISECPLRTVIFLNVKYCRNHPPGFVKRCKRLTFVK